MDNCNYALLFFIFCVKKTHSENDANWGVSKLGFCPVLFRNELVAFQKELVLFKKYTQTFGLFILPLEKNRC